MDKLCLIFTPFGLEHLGPLMAMTVNVLVFVASKATKTQNEMVAWLKEEISLNSFLKSLFYNSVGYLIYNRHIQEMQSLLLIS